MPNKSKKNNAAGQSLHVLKLF